MEPYYCALAFGSFPPVNLWHGIAAENWSASCRCDDYLEMTMSYEYLLASMLSIICTMQYQRSFWTSFDRQLLIES